MKLIEDNQIVCNSISQSMSYSDKVSDSYRLDVTFPSEYNSEEFAELVDYIDIDIRSWQDISK